MQRFACTYGMRVALVPVHAAAAKHLKQKLWQLLPRLSSMAQASNISQQSSSTYEVHRSSLICLVNELAHELAFSEQVQMIVANVLHCWTLGKPDAFQTPPPWRTAGNAATV